MSTDNEDPLAFLKAEAEKSTGPEPIAVGGPEKLGPRVYSDDRVFRIDAAPMPWTTIIAMNLLFIACGCGFHLLAKRSLEGEPLLLVLLLAYVAPLVICLFTCVVSIAAICYFAAGKPWLVYDKTTRRVDLPRHQVSFDRRDVVQVEYDMITASGPDRGVKLTWALYLITRRDGELKRWSLVNRAFVSIGPEYFLVPLTRQTDLPVVRTGATRLSSPPWYSEPWPERPYAAAELPEEIVDEGPQSAAGDQPPGGNEDSERGRS